MQRDDPEKRVSDLFKVLHLPLQLGKAFNYSTVTSKEIKELDANQSIMVPHEMSVASVVFKKGNEVEAERLTKLQMSDRMDESAFTLLMCSTDIVRTIPINLGLVFCGKKLKEKYPEFIYSPFFDKNYKKYLKKDYTFRGEIGVSIKEISGYFIYDENENTKIQFMEYFNDWCTYLTSYYGALICSKKHEILDLVI